MAQLIGNAGVHIQEKAINRRLNIMTTVFICACLFTYAMGYLSARWNLLWTILALAACGIGSGILRHYFEKHIRLARNEDDGAAGEREIIPYLKQLPETYTVFSDLDFAGSYGNIDHLVIGPTGIFSIDVKNWKGTVSADGKGELLWNGEPTNKPHVRAFTARTMDLKDRLRALTTLDPYIQCLFVFPHTHLNANWGTTGSVHCIHAHQLADYIEKGKGGKPLPPADISRLVSAITALKETIAVKKETNMTRHTHQPAMHTTTTLSR